MLFEPLLIFLVLGALLFGLHTLVNDQPPEPDTALRIQVTAADIDQLRAGWQRQRGRPPHPEELQIIKGWFDEAGELHEKIYEVAWSGDRQLDTAGQLQPVGNTVDLANATWTNTIGAGELITVWQDPDFDPAQPAFYYARVIQIPTPRWSTYDARYYMLELPPEVPRTTQKRTYTSPIWYTP